MLISWMRDAGVQIVFTDKCFPVFTDEIGRVHFKQTVKLFAEVLDILEADLKRYFFDLQIGLYH